MAILTRIRNINWGTLSAVVQAISAVVLTVLGIYAFFFSPLSQRLEEHLRTEVTVAKQDLIAARQSKLVIERERDELLASTDRIRVARDRLTSEVSELERKLAGLENDRSAYARSTLSTVRAKYLAMVSYEMAYMRAIASICAQYGQHILWLSRVRELARLEAEWEKLPSAQQYDEKLPINKRRDALRKYEFDTPDFWIQVPHPPRLSPSDPDIAVSAHAMTVMSKMEKHESLHSYVHGWLLKEIVDQSGTRAIKAADFLAKTKQYPFLEPLLPSELEGFRAHIDVFLVKHPQHRETQLNVTTPAAPSPDQIIAAGKKHLGALKAFEADYLAYLNSPGVETNAISQKK